MSKLSRSFAVTALLLLALTIAALAFLRARAVPACAAADQPWRATDLATLGDFSDIIRRARADYIVSPIDGAHRWLVYQRAYRPSDSDIDLVFAPSGVRDAFIVYRYNWHIGGWYCKVRVASKA